MSYASKDMQMVKSQIHSVMRYVMVISFPCTVGLAVLGEPICRLLFPATADTAPMAGTMLWAGALVVVFYSMSTLSNGLLQGIDKLNIPVINSVISLVAHVILLMVLMLFLRMNIYAVVIANMFFSLLMCILNARAIAKYSGYRQEYKKTFMIPAVASVLMGAVTFFFYKGCHMLIKSNAVSTILGIFVAVAAYAVSLLLLHGMDEEDLLHFPKGELLVRIAKKLHLLH